MEKEILKSITDAERALGYMKNDEALSFICALVRKMEKVFSSGGKLLIAGNGGSLCDAAHFAEELTGFFRTKRRALPAMVLSEPSHMSCVANDTAFDLVFARMVEAFGKPEDLLILLSTSGNSFNLIAACDAALCIPMEVAAFLGKGGGELALRTNLKWIVPEFTTSDRIQEVHMTAIHIAIEMLERSYLFNETFSHHEKKEALCTL